jgi:hypothetical protein
MSQPGVAGQPNDPSGEGGGPVCPTDPPTDGADCTGAALERCTYGSVGVLFECQNVGNRMLWHEWKLGYASGCPATEPHNNAACGDPRLACEYADPCNLPQRGGPGAGGLGRVFVCDGGFLQWFNYYYVDCPQDVPTNGASCGACADNYAQCDYNLVCPQQLWQYEATCENDVWMVNEPPSPTNCP